MEGEKGVYELGGATQRDCIIFLSLRDSFDLTANISTGGSGDGVGYHNNHVLY